MDVVLGWPVTWVFGVLCAILPDVWRGSAIGLAARALVVVLDRSHLDHIRQGPAGRIQADHWP